MSWPWAKYIPKCVHPLSILLLIHWAGSEMYFLTANAHEWATPIWMCFDPLNEVYMLPLLEEALLEKQLSLLVASHKSPVFHLGHACVALTHPDVSPFCFFAYSPCHILGLLHLGTWRQGWGTCCGNIENHTASQRSVPLLSLDFERIPCFSGRVTIQVCQDPRANTAPPLWAQALPLRSRHAGLQIDRALKAVFALMSL